MIAATARTIAAKLGEATPRERAGLALLAALLAIVGAIYAMDWANASARDAESATQRATNAASMLAVFQDDARRQHLEAEAAKVWRWSRTGDALASEETLAELEALCSQAGLNEAAVTPVEEAPPSGGVGVFAASITAAFDWAGFVALLEAFGDAEMSVIVRSIDVTDDVEGQRMTMVVAVPMVNTGDAP